MITPAQIRAARSLLGWSQRDLAARCGLSQTALTNIERGAADPKVSTLQRIHQALEEAGVVFIAAGGGEGEGVRFSTGGG